MVRPDLLQRCSRAHVSALDRRLAAMVGEAAVDAAVSTPLAGGVMVSLRRRPEGWKTELVSLEDVHGERTVPREILDDPSPLGQLLE